MKVLRITFPKNTQEFNFVDDVQADAVYARMINSLNTSGDTTRSLAVSFDFNNHQAVVNLRMAQCVLLLGEEQEATIQAIDAFKSKHMEKVSKVVSDDIGSLIESLFGGKGGGRPVSLKDLLRNAEGGRDIGSGPIGSGGINPEQSSPGASTGQPTKGVRFGDTSHNEASSTSQPVSKPTKPLTIQPVDHDHTTTRE